MSRVLALVEGRTEQTFIQQILAPALGYRNVHIYPRVIGKPGHKGGVGEFERARNEIVALLRQEPTSFCTTMFDYYGMPDSWPGVAHVKGRPYTEIPRVVEAAIKNKIVATMGASFRPDRFIPYVQMHEFEALLFSDPATLAGAVGSPVLVQRFQSIVNECRACEAIDDGATTAPSKRIAALVPAYQKVVYGAIAAKRIGLAVMRQKCSHFNDWIGQLETLGSEGPSKAS
jgi:hypothetical protein